MRESRRASQQWVVGGIGIVTAAGKLVGFAERDPEDELAEIEATVSEF